MAQELRGEERISGPYQIPTSRINKRSRIGSVAHYAHDYGWDVYVYECVNYTGDSLQKNGKVKTGKEETYTWVVGKKQINGKWYVFKFSEFINKINGYWVDYADIKRIITGEIDAENLLPQR
jgi:hypothetical protein